MPPPPCRCAAQRSIDCSSRRLPRRRTETPAPPVRTSAGTVHATTATQGESPKSGAGPVGSTRTRTSAGSLTTRRPSGTYVAPGVCPSTSTHPTPSDRARTTSASGLPAERLQLGGEGVLPGHCGAPDDERVSTDDSRGEPPGRRIESRTSVVPVERAVRLPGQHQYRRRVDRHGRSSAVPPRRPGNRVEPPGQAAAKRGHRRQRQQQGHRGEEPGAGTPTRSARAPAPAASATAARRDQGATSFWLSRSSPTAPTCWVRCASADCPQPEAAAHATRRPSPAATASPETAPAALRPRHRTASPRTTAAAHTRVTTPVSQLSAPVARRRRSTRRQSPTGWAGCRAPCPLGRRTQRSLPGPRTRPRAAAPTATPTAGQGARSNPPPARCVSSAGRGPRSR